MCNAWNHPMDCTCGWGGEGHLGRRTAGYSAPAASWSIRNSSGRLAYPSACWWCGAQVFFYRNESGGCALFDHPGWPWPLHSCWEEYREQTLDRVESELNGIGFNGSFYKRALKEVRRPGASEVVEVQGHVSDNHALYRDEDRVLVRLKSSSRAATVPLVVVEVCVRDQGYRFLMPELTAKGIPDYSPIEVRGIWLKRGRRWNLFATAFRTVEPGRRRASFRTVSTIERRCSYCAGLMSGGSWGIDSHAMVECRPCGELRGNVDREAFLNRVRSIAEALS